MSDLCRCTGGDCLLKNNCLRYTAVVYGRQDFFGQPPYESESYTCPYFIDDKPTYEAVQRLAYSLWQKAGRPLNQDIAFWLQAEKELLHLKRNSI